MKKVGLVLFIQMLFAIHFTEKFLTSYHWRYMVEQRLDGTVSSSPFETKEKTTTENLRIKIEREQSYCQLELNSKRP